MVRGRRAVLRTLARVAAPLAVGGLTVGLGIAPALGDPGNGNGNPNPPGHSSSPTTDPSNHATDGTSGTFGSPTSPQPLQQPDNQGQGANTFPGPYSSTRDGSPSLNGNGDGLAGGKPCAGCVGKADNKNPHGQFPNGSDPNAGYECDRNNGIGRSNPAHTGCDSPSTPVPVTSAAKLTNDVSVLGISLPRVSLPDALAFTGSSTPMLVLVGFTSLVVGGAMLVLQRLRIRGT
jgi:hypothetical protein